MYGQQMKKCRFLDIYIYIYLKIIYEMSASKNCYLVSLHTRHFYNLEFFGGHLSSFKGQFELKANLCAAKNSLASTVALCARPCAGERSFIVVHLHLHANLNLSVTPCRLVLDFKASVMPSVEKVPTANFWGMPIS